MTLLGPGVTLRMSLDQFRNVAAGLKSGVERLEDDDARFGTTSIN